MMQDTLYKRDTKGKVREWRMEIDGARYRTISGLQDGEQVTTEWTVAKGKNVGRANETTDEEQAAAEVRSQYKKKLRVDYHTSLDDIDVIKVYKPMLATGWKKRKSKIDWNGPKVFSQPKLDGIRCISPVNGLWSRTGMPIVATPHVAAAMTKVYERFPTLTVDGELYNHDLKHDFNEIESIVRTQKLTKEQIAKATDKIEYHVYDCDDGTGLDFDQRYQILMEVVKIANKVAPGVVHLVETKLVTSEAQCDEVYGKYIEDGYEGGIIRINSEYQQNKRSNFLIKRKDFEDAEFTILRIEEGKGNWSGVAKRVFFENDVDGREVGAGLKGSKDYARHVLENADSYIGKQVTVQFFTRTPDGVPRFPIAKQLHKDKRW